MLFLTPTQTHKVMLRAFHYYTKKRNMISDFELYNHIPTTKRISTSRSSQTKQRNTIGMMLTAQKWYHFCHYAARDNVKEVSFWNPDSKQHPQTTFVFRLCKISSRIDGKCNEPTLLWPTQVSNISDYKRYIHYNRLRSIQTLRSLLGQLSRETAVWNKRKINCSFHYRMQHVYILLFHGQRQYK